MPVSYESFDPIAFFERYSRLRPNSRVGKQWQGACPFDDCPADDDGFIVWPTLTDKGCHYYCRVCGRAGDAIAFLQEHDGLTFRQACLVLGLSADARSTASARPMKIDPDGPPSEQWQERACQFAHTCKACLWSDAGWSVREYLHRRGFTDERIHRAGLGYHALPNGAWKAYSGQEWGNSDRQTIWIPRGLVIPWVAEGQFWKLNIRRGDKDIARDLQRDQGRGVKPRKRKYVEVQGSRDGLYNANSLRPGKPVLLLESELDVLAALQADVRSLSAVVATGSTGRGRTPAALAALALASFVLVGFDVDENKRGDEAADWWLTTLPAAIRWRPWTHDVNEMLMEGLQIRQWVEIGLSVAATPCSEDDELSAVCLVCGADIERYSPEGIAYCAEHFPGDEAPGSRPLPYEQFMSVVERIAAVFPGGCTVHVDPPGYTLEEHVRRREQEQQAASHWARSRRG